MEALAEGNRASAAARAPALRPSAFLRSSYRLDPAFLGFPHAIFQIFQRTGQRTKHGTPTQDKIFRMLVMLIHLGGQ